jgi:hypothetical protein
MSISRRRRTVRSKRFLGFAADTDDLPRWLIAWVWHNWEAKDQVGAVMECARRIGRKGMQPTEAAEIIEEARIT